jgi:2',3'-cyclic-nucleotide 2'-phosphodiesterase (5'-nucleotidase family)
VDEHAGPGPGQGGGRGQVGGRHSRPLPPARPGTALRVLATTDLAGTLVPIRTSYGEGGTCAGVVELLERERDRQPTVWLDAGDFTVGPTSPLLGERPWADMAALPITAAAAGNHEFDDGVPALLEAARLLPYPLLCANVEVGLPPAAMVETGAGPLGVIGLTHPHVHRLSQAPPLAEDWPERVGPLARQLRSQGARWVAAILHDGVDWWPNPDPGGPPTRSRSQRLAALAAPWADQVDLIVGGHVPDAWAGELAGTPAGHAHVFAASVVVVDLPGHDGARPEVRGWFPVPAVRPSRGTPATRALDAAAARVVGESRHTWLSRTGARRYLPDLIAQALRQASGAGAGMVLAAQHLTQGSLDGVTAALPAGPVTELDLMWLFALADDRPVSVELRPGEFQDAVAGHDAISDPQARHADRVWWNWSRMPAGVSVGPGQPHTVAVMSWVVPRLGELLGRDLVTEPATTGAREALLRTL